MTAQDNKPLVPGHDIVSRRTDLLLLLSSVLFADLVAPRMVLTTICIRSAVAASYLKMD